MTSDDDFLDKRGIDPAVWAARGCRRYEPGDTWVKDEFRGFPATTGKIKKAREMAALLEREAVEAEEKAARARRNREDAETKANKARVKATSARRRAEGLAKQLDLRDVTTAINQGPGWLMPKHAPPGYPPAPPQLRPDDKVVMGPPEKWHYHGPAWTERPVYPPEAGAELAGRPLRDEYVVVDVLSGQHIDAVPKETEQQYDPATGVGKHNGQNVDVVHKHIDEGGKYILLGQAARIDLHPWALQRLPDSPVAFLILEGGPKTDSVISAGGCAFGVPSVTLWDQRELKRFAAEYLQDKTVLVIPDSDWATNWQVERQALRVRSVLRRCGIASTYIAAPPTKKDCLDRGIAYHNGIDDFLGADHALGELMLDGREPPEDHILAAVWRVSPHQRRRSAFRGLVDMALYVNQEGRLAAPERLEAPPLPVLREWFGMSHTSRVVPLLQSISHCFAVERGTLETEQMPLPPGGKRTVTVWKEPPTITLHEQYRAHRQRTKLLSEDFWQRTAFEQVNQKVQDHDERLAALEAAARRMAA